MSMNNAPGQPPSHDPVRNYALEAEISQRRQRNALIGLAIGSSLVLIIGIIAVLLTRSGDSGNISASTSSVVDTSTSTTSSTTTTSTTSTTTTTTEPLPATPVADAGPDLAVDAGQVVTLEAVAVTEGVDPAAVTWRQIDGVDVTSGVGALGGQAVSFGAPDDVTTLRFELVVDAGDDEPATDEIVVRVFEDVERSVFVDGERGDDGADGTMEAPLRTLSAAAATGDDIYLRSVGTYAASQTIRLTADASMYGGFTEDWVRDRTQRVVIVGAAVAVVVDGDGDRTLSSLDITSGDADPGGRSVAVRIINAESVSIEDSRLVAGAAGGGSVDGSATGERSAAVSAGVLAVDTGEVRIIRSTVNGGSGGDGAIGADAAPRDAADDGGDATGPNAGDGASDPNGSRSGGDGGDGVAVDDGDAGRNGGSGALGGDGGLAPGGEASPGQSGTGGLGGAGGDGGNGLAGDDDTVPVGQAGAQGAAASPGTGAGGGGGGAGSTGVGVAVVGGGGGGGGAGGLGGQGAVGGGGGGGSIGLWAVGVDRVVINESLVASGRGGRGAAGGSGGNGGDGGAGGNGAPGEADLAVAGDGAGAGGGGAGGVGGHGGGGAGGPSYGMLTTLVDAVEITSSTVRGGGGGAGAAGGLGGAAGADGGDATGLDGALGGSTDAGSSASAGVGASGGSSLGWFDNGNAVQTFDAAEIIEGVAGQGGPGSVVGETGAQSDANV